MNAVIALCHFCETHGPSAIFCTQTLRDTNLNNLSYNGEPKQQQQSIVDDNKKCTICSSIGTTIGIISKDPDSNANFLSTQIPIIPEVYKLIKQASIRSLSCEVNCSKDDFIFFGDSSRGHVLSHTFQINDLQARGFYRLFSIIVLMKDKFFLLNIKPFLSEHLQKISEELKSKAKVLYNSEEEIGSGRNRRLSSGENISTNQSTRSLVQLTNEKNIFYVLHSHFSWILLTGSKILTEKITFSNILWSPMMTIKLNKKIINTTINTSTTLSHNEGPIEFIGLPDSNVDDCATNYSSIPISFRYLKSCLKDEFTSACYCTLTGIKIIIRGPLDMTHKILMCFRKILPDELHQLTHFNTSQYLIDDNVRIVTVVPEIPVPLPNINVYRIDFYDENDGNNKILTKWHGKLPEKLPSLLHKITKAVDEPLFTDTVLDKRLKVLIQEWKNKMICLNCTNSTSQEVEMRKVLGIQEQDNPLVNYWREFV